MKLLFDENISFKVSKKLKNVFPDCKQVTELNLQDKTDRELWNFAKKENFTIVTFDADLYDLVTLFGHPPKIIWLRIGNTNSENLVSILNNHKNIITAFVDDKNFGQIGCLEIK